MLHYTCLDDPELEGLLHEAEHLARIERYLASLPAGESPPDHPGDDDAAGRLIDRPAAPAPC
jgi:hypothetical protein